MKKNVGGWDRRIRWIVGAGALAAALTGRWRLAARAGAFALAATEFTTAATRFCPLNSVLKLNTNRAGTHRFGG
jgi:hypothetical protein